MVISLLLFAFKLASHELQRTRDLCCRQVGLLNMLMVNGCLARLAQSDMVTFETELGF
jgi:hypothetical protein